MLGPEAVLAVEGLNIENTPYMESISAARALLLDEETALEGTTTLSLETQADLAEQDILTFINENFRTFMKVLRCLNSEDQELVLSYYILSKPQTVLARVQRSTQTVCSSRIRMAIKTLATFIMMGGEPPEEILHKVLEKAGFEDKLVKVPLSKAIVMYVEKRNFTEVADTFGVHRPEVRRWMRRASDALLESTDPEEAAVAVWIHSLLERANATGTGYSKRQRAKQGNHFLQSADITGEFRLRVEDPGFSQMFMARANR